MVQWLHSNFVEDLEVPNWCSGFSLPGATEKVGVSL